MDLRERFASYLKYAGEKLSPEKPQARKPPTYDDNTPPDLSQVDQYADPLKDITPTVIANALESADSGDPRELSVLAERMIERGGCVTAHWNTRRLAVMGCDWDVVAVDKGNDGKAKELRKMLDAAGVKGMIPHLHNAMFLGYSSALTEWNPDGAPKRFIPVHSSRIVFDLAGNPALVLGMDGKTTSVASLPYGQAVFCHPECSPLPFKEGLCRSIIHLWVYWRDAVLHRAQHLDKYSTPPIMAKVPRDMWDNKTKLYEMAERILSMGKKGLVVYPEGGEIASMDMTSNSNTDFGAFLTDLERVIVQLILGQEATSGDSNGMSNGDAQSAVRMDILEADCRMVGNAITRQILAPLVTFKYGEAMADAFEFKLDYEEDEDLNLRATMIKTLADAGFKADREWVSETFNMPLSEEEPISPISPISPIRPINQTAQKQPKQLAMSDSPLPLAAKEEFVSRVTESALRQLFVSTEAMAEFYRPLRDEIAMSFSDLDLGSPDMVKAFSERADRFFSRYPSIYRGMVDSSDGFQRVFQGAVLTAATGDF